MVDRGAVMVSGTDGNHVSTSRTTSTLLYRFKKLRKPVVTTVSTTESPGMSAANGWSRIITTRGAVRRSRRMLSCDSFKDLQAGAVLVEGTSQGHKLRAWRL